MKQLLLFATLTFCLNSFGQVPAYVPTNPLIGWWPFDGNIYYISEVEFEQV